MTPKQLKTFQFIDDYIALHGFAPSLREIGKGIGLGPGGAFRYVESLVYQGFLRKDATHNRSLQVLRRPEGSALPLPGAERLRSASDDQLDQLRRDLSTEISRRTMAKAFARADAILGATQ